MFCGWSVCLPYDQVSARNNVHSLEVRHVLVTPSLAEKKLIRRAGRPLASKWKHHRRAINNFE